MSLSTEESADSYPRPTSEDECARICGYNYTSTNILDHEQKAEQERYIRLKFGKEFAEADACSCVVINGVKCDDDSCPNRNDCVACSVDCGPFCKNNPWIHGFAAGKKTYLGKDDSKGFGLFANEVIEENEWIGEYTGRIVKANVELPTIQQSYAFRIPKINQMINPNSEGSCIKLINHSCNPNCESWTYLHDKRFKVVYMAKRRIEKDEEVTVDYHWEYKNANEAIECHCKSKDEPHFIGRLQKSKTKINYVQQPDSANKSPSSHFTDSETNDGYSKGPVLKIKTPTTVESIEITANKMSDLKETSSTTRLLYDSVATGSKKDILLSLLSRPVGHCVRPAKYQECHIFPPFSRTFALVFKEGQVRVVCGRAIECSLSEDGAVIYKIYSLYPVATSFQIVRWLCFHYHEDAEFVMRHLLTGKDIKDLQTYSENPNLVPASHLVPEYVKKIQANDLPETELLPSCTPGFFVLGGATQRLALKRTSAPGITENTLTSDGLVSSAMDSNSQECCYNPRQQQDLEKTLSKHQQEVYLNRMLDMACETATLFAMSRLPANLSHIIDYRIMQRTIRQDLETLYFDTPPQHRKFLTFAHYKLAINVHAEGSLGWLWCSLCKLSRSFQYEMALRRHFDDIHAICLKTFSCYSANCAVSCTLPSEFRKHLQHCSPKIETGFIYTLPGFIMDAYSDIVRTKGPANHPMYLVQPGMPGSIVTEGQRSSKKKGAKAEIKEELQMDLVTNKPTNVNAVKIPVKLKIQEQYTLLKQLPAHPLVNLTPSIAPATSTIDVNMDKEKMGATPSQNQAKKSKSTTARSHNSSLSRKRKRK